MTTLTHPLERRVPAPDLLRLICGLALVPVALRLPGEHLLRCTLLLLLLLVVRRLAVSGGLDLLTCTVLVAATWSGPARGYGLGDRMDVVAHVLVPCVLALVAAEALSSAVTLPPSAVAAVAGSTGLSAAALWELYEWAVVGVLGPASLGTGYVDTLRDLAGGCLGALLAGSAVLVLLRLSVSPRGDRPTAATPDARHLPGERAPSRGRRTTALDRSRVETAVRHRA